MKMDLKHHKPAQSVVLFLTMMSLVALLVVSSGLAQEPAGHGPNPEQKQAPSFETPTMTGDFKSAIVIDAETGLVLVAANARVRRQPASMLKMMTELIVLEHIADGDLKMDETVTVSARSSKMGGSQVYLKHGETFSVEELLEALAIHSANDAAVALAEHLAGSVEAFVDLMNMRAQDLGMKNSEFHSVHGLPAGYKQSPDLTTAEDLAILGREMIKHPRALEWASTKTAPFRDGKFTLYNPNKLVGTFRGLDGIKTGFTSAAGFCVTASAVQKGKRLISVVMGCTTNQARATETTRLLTYGFNAYKQVKAIPTAGVLLPDPVGVKGGKVSETTVKYGAALTVMIPRNREADFVVENRLPEKLEAPLPAGEEVGQAVVLLDGVELGRVPLILAEELPKGNWWNRLMNK